MPPKNKSDEATPDENEEVDDAPATPPDEATPDPEPSGAEHAAQTAPPAVTAPSGGLLGAGGQPPTGTIEEGDQIAAANAGYDHVALGDGREFDVDPETGKVTKVLS